MNRQRKPRDRPAPMFLAYGVTAEEWTRRYGVEPFTHPCSECGRELTTSIPFVKGKIHGLTAPTCECGNERTPYVILLEEMTR